MVRLVLRLVRLGNLRLHHLGMVRLVHLGNHLLHHLGTVRLVHLENLLLVVMALSELLILLEVFQEHKRLHQIQVHILINQLRLDLLHLV